MSREFESLQKTSELPSWLTDEVQLADQWLLIMGGTHGDEQGQVNYVRSQMHPGAYPAGVLPIIANRAASDLGVRYIGTEQLMGWYPGRFHWQAQPEEPLTNEEQTAAGITWLADRLVAGRLVMDRHENSNPGVRYVVTGTHVTPDVLAAAYLMGHTDIIINPSSWFYRAVPGSFAVEESVPRMPSENEAYYNLVNQQIYQIAKLGRAGLRELYYDEKLWDGFTCYDSMTEILLADSRTKLPNPDVLAILSEIEAVGDGLVYGEELPISLRAREVLGLHPCKQYVVADGGYSNWSEELDLPADVLKNVGLSEDRQRRLTWGSLMVRCAAPAVE